MHIPWDLIKKYCKGNLSEMERLSLTHWCDAKEINQLFFEEVIGDDYFKTTLVQDTSQNHAAQWASIYNRLTPVESTYSFSRKYFLFTVTLAATILLLIGIGATYLFNSWQSRGYSENDFTYVFSPRGQRTQVILPDSTRVWLNSETSIRYPVSFNKKTREVTIVGEAFFKVKKNPDKPFLVNTTDIKVKVYGTSFNVKAYPNEKYIETTLIEGKLSVIPQAVADLPENEILLHPKDRLKFRRLNFIDNSNAVSSTVKSKQNREKREVLPKLLLSRNINPDQENLWKDGKLIFMDEKFADMAVKMERWFDVKIHFEDEKIKDFRFTGQFDKETINQAMEALEISSQHTYQYNIIFRDIYIKSIK